jgi:hypothetical protein
MAQKLGPGRTKPLTHNEQETIDKNELAGVFLNSVRTLAECDEDLTQGESSVLLNSTKEAQQDMGASDDEEIETIGKELRTISDQVDGVVQGYAGYFDQMLAQEDSDQMAETFLQVGGRVFEKGVTLGGIIVLLVFSYKLVKLYMRKLKNRAKQILQKDITSFLVRAGTFLAKAFVKYNVLQWVRRQGGWSEVVLDNWPQYAIVFGVALIVTTLAVSYWKS